MESTPVCTFCRPSCVQKPSSTNEIEVRSPSHRRISALCAGGGDGRPKARTVFWAENSALPQAPSALQASGRHRTTVVRDVHCLGSARWWVARKLQSVFRLRSGCECSCVAGVGKKRQESKESRWSHLFNVLPAFNPNPNPNLSLSPNTEDLSPNPNTEDSPRILSTATAAPTASVSLRSVREISTKVGVDKRLEKHGCKRGVHNAETHSWGVDHDNAVVCLSVVLVNITLTTMVRVQRWVHMTTNNKTGLSADCPLLREDGGAVCGGDDAYDQTRVRTGRRTIRTRGTCCGCPHMTSRRRRSPYAPTSGPRRASSC